MNVNLDAIRSGTPLKELMGRLPKIPTASAVSGLIVAALILMTPNPWFEAFIVETGLPSVLGAAQPPLGARARIVFALVAALIVTSAAWVILSFILNRKQRAAAEADYHAEDFDETQERYGSRAGALRQADAHPDAPYRRPIMAEDDLGTPLDLVDIAPQDMSEAEVADEPLDLGAVAEIVAEEKPIATVEDVDTGDSEDFEAVETEAEAPPAEPVFEVPLPRRDDPVAEEAAPAEKVDSFTLPEDTRTELTKLVDRLEAGLERKKAREQHQRAETGDQVSGQATQRRETRPAADRDAALRDALDTLQQVAAKQG
ncbi:hypothetical protein [Parasphingopyxis sp.]|uniref:hypothetical protein n=1 Tax=Parasphingopyxis sp. TaxID=1920299 RepID=UPI0026330E21|nr:hypothetical protein [Parasphingopyxis sp.]